MRVHSLFSKIVKQFFLIRVFTGKTSTFYITTSMRQPVNIFWFRRDLRLKDNAGLYHALRSGNSVLPVFIFDAEILNGLDDKKDRRVAFIHFFLKKIKSELNTANADLLVLHGKPLDVFRKITSEYDVKKVFTNHDYEPYAEKRDGEVRALLNEKGVDFQAYKDQVIFEKDEILKDDGTPYTVYTPYSKKWKARMNDFFLKSYPTEKYFGNFFRPEHPFRFIELSEIGFEMPENFDFPPAELDLGMLKKYHELRDFPAVRGTSRLSVHLRFGTVSIRELARVAKKESEKFLNELIWREFYMMILWHFPHVVTRAFKPEYDQIEWRNHEEEFQKWCEGKTVYPIVDAGMRELNTTGYMHNRVRMITASFLIKHLLIDWRWGEAYFAKKLLDFDLAANNGSWQWVAGSGCDGAPYFRVFNPALQTDKFDPEFRYIRKYVREFGTPLYPPPMVKHEFARDRVLEAYKKAVGAESMGIIRQESKTKK